MAESSGIRAGKAFVELSLQDKFSKAIDKAAKKLKGMGDTLTSIGKKTALAGGALTAPFLVAAQRFAAMGDEVNKASQRTGVGVEALEELKYAAEQSGMSFEDLENSLRKMQKSMYDGEHGSKQIADAFKELGLKLSDLQAIQPDEQFVTLGAAINSVADPSRRAALALTLLGRSGTALLPMFADGVEGVNELINRSNKLGLIFSKEDAEAATHFGDTLDDLWKQIKMVTFQAGASIANALQPFADETIKCLGAVIAWTKENRALVVGLAAAAALVPVLGGAIFTLAIGLKTLSFTLSGISVGLKALLIVLGLITNPIALIGSALVALVAYFVYASSNGTRLLTYLGDRFTALGLLAKTALGGISDALKVGQMRLAAEIAVTAIELAFEPLREYFSELWESIGSTLVRAFVQSLAHAKIALAEFSEKTSGTIAKAEYLYANKAQDNKRKQAQYAIDFYQDLEKNGGTLNKSQQADLANQKQNLKDAIAEQARLANEFLPKDKGRSAELQSKIDAINAERDAVLAAQDSIDRKSSDGGQKRLSELQKKLRDLLQEVGTEGPSASKPIPSGDEPGLISPKIDLKSLKNYEKSVPSTGLFNVAGLQGLMQPSNSNDDAIKKATEETARNTKKMADRQVGFT